MIFNPKILLLIDFLGALVTAICLLVIRFFFGDYFTMPQWVLLPLALVASAFSMYSFCGYLSVKDKQTSFLNVISLANLVYAITLLIILGVYRSRLTVFDWIYFLLEASIIFVLIFFERQTLLHNTTAQS